MDSNLRLNLSLRTGNLLSDVPVSYEDLDTYTLVDSDGTYSVSGNILILTDSYPDHEESYLYYDFGAGYFKTSLEIDFEVKINSLIPDNGADVIGGLILTNVLGNRNAVGSDGGPILSLRSIDNVTTDAYTIFCGDNSYSLGAGVDLFSVGTQYYCTVLRTYGDPGSVVVSVYDDSARTNLVYAPYGLPNAVPEEKAVVTYRYLLLGQSNRINAEDCKVTYTIKNVRIISNG